MLQSSSLLTSYIQFVLTAQPLSFMQKAFQEQIQQLTTYMRTVIQQGVDISALYIIQAYLTTLKTFLKPTTILNSLFSFKQLSKMVTLTRTHLSHLKIRQDLYNANRKCPDYDLMLKFKLSFKNIDQNPLKDLSVLAQQILQTLEEWEVITTKSQNFRQKLSAEGGTIKEEEESLLEQLEQQMKLIQAYNEKELRITESTECFSSISQNQIPLSNKKMGGKEVTTFYEYITMWINEIMQEITDFKAIISFTKEESSVDLEQDSFSIVYYQEHRQSSPTLFNKAKKETKIFNGLKKNTPKDKVISFQKDLGQKTLKQGKQNMQRQLQEKRLYSSSSIQSTKTLYASKNERVIFGDVGSKQGLSRVKREVADKRREQGCNRCDIY